MVTADKTIRFGVIGCGLMGRHFAIAAKQWGMLREFPARPQIVAACDVSPDNLAWFESNVETLVETTSDYRALLAREDVDAVYCAVPHNLHAEIYIETMRAGKHLLAEKPFGIDLSANRRIMATVAEHPQLLVRISSEFPFFPGAQRIAAAVREGRFGTIIEARSGFLHSSDLDPRKPINWKRKASTNGEYGCMGDLGLHAVHMPFRFGWHPVNVRALLSNIVKERPDKKGVLVPCDTWDNAVLATEVETGGNRFPMLIETKRIAPGETNTWYLTVFGTKYSASFSTKYPRTLWTLGYKPDQEQAWQRTDLGYHSAYPTVADGIFEFGFTDAVLQMWAAFVDELAHGESMRQPFLCATPEEAELSHWIFSAALESQRSGQVVELASIEARV